jgi:hypothetical protein
VRRAAPALLSTVLLALLPWTAATAQPPDRIVLLILLPPMSYEEAMGWAPLEDLGRAGGVALMTTGPSEDRTEEDTVLDGGARPGTTERILGEQLVLARPAGEQEVVAVLEDTLAPPDREVLVVAVSPLPSEAMRQRGDVVTPVVLARGRAEDLLDAAGTLGGLASDTTRRQGLVANLDVAPTLFGFLDEPIPAAMLGSPLRVEGEAPDLLHERYLAVRELRIPVQIGALVLGLVVLLGGTAFLLMGGRSAATARLLAIGGLVALALPAAFLPASDLPRVAWWTVLPVAALVVALIVGAGIRLGRRDPTIPVAVVAAASASILVLDAVLGWRASMMPFFGGTALEGGRFFGLGNINAGVLLAGAVLTAAHLPPRWGMGLLLGAALFAGLPWLGSNFGAALTLFAAAGLWLGLRVRRRLGWAEVAAAAGVTIMGTAAVVAVHAFLAAGETHVARLAEEAGRTGLGPVFEALGRRLGVAVRVTSQVPAAWLLPPALAGMAVVAWRRWGYLARDPAWRDAVVVLCLAGLVGFVANDTGIGVGGLAFAFAAAALGYPTLEERWTTA